MQVCKCGSFKIENKDLSLCSVCNRERRKAEAPQKPQKVYELKRTEIKAVSTKKAAALSRKHKTQQEMAKKDIRWCETCGRADRPLSHSHVLSVGQYPQFEAVAENQIYECFGSRDSCHDVWENGTLEQKMEQSTWQRKIDVIMKLQPKHFNKIMLKNDIH